jgi:hypothetical protein
MFVIDQKGKRIRRICDLCHNVKATCRVGEVCDDCRGITDIPDERIVRSNYRQTARARKYAGRPYSQAV